MKWFCFSDLCSHGPPAATVSSSLCRNDKCSAFWKQKGGGTSAEGAEGVGCVEEVSPLPSGEGSGEGTFFILELKIYSFAAF